MLFCQNYDTRDVCMTLGGKFSTVTNLSDALCVVAYMNISYGYGISSERCSLTLDSEKKLSMDFYRLGTNRIPVVSKFQGLTRQAVRLELK